VLLWLLLAHKEPVALMIALGEYLVSANQITALSRKKEKAPLSLSIDDGLSLSFNALSQVHKETSSKEERRCVTFSKLEIVTWRSVVQLQQHNLKINLNFHDKIVYDKVLS
jgi:hypothetical protein